MIKAAMSKPQKRNRESVEVYHSESVYVDSTTTVMEACGGCHNLSKTHGPRVTLSFGVGGSVPGLSGSIMTNGNGSVTTTLHGGMVGLGGISYNSGAGPNIVVGRSGSLSAAQRSVSLSGSSSTTSARQDNTRTN